MMDEAPVQDWQSKLSWVVPGDLVSGREEGKRNLVYLVESVGPDCLRTRRITTQEKVTFDIETAEAIEAPGCRLGSIVPLPVEVHDVLLGLDRKMRLSDQPISDAEKAALDFADEVSLAHPLGTTGRRGGKTT